MKKLTLNEEKRKTIAGVFQDHWEATTNPKRQAHIEAIKNYDKMRESIKPLITKVVREKYPQEDVDTIRRMTMKYGENGGQLYHDNCFELSTAKVGVDENGNEEEGTDELRVKFGLTDLGKDFANSYYRQELKSKDLNPDYKVKHEYSNDSMHDRKNPRYYDDDNATDKYLGFQNSSNEDKSIKKHLHEWDNDFKLWVIGSNYCHSRTFKVDKTTFEIFKMYQLACENVELTHKQLYSYVEDKMKKLRLGLKSYRYFDQAKELADKLGVPLNESVLNESSSMALSVYSPENLASLLEDKVQLTRDQKIAMFRQQQQVVN